MSTFLEQDQTGIPSRDIDTRRPENRALTSRFARPSGTLNAVIVLVPETWTAARSNRLLTSLALGSGIASIALTIPAVVIYSLSTGTDLMLGLEPKNMVFLITTFLVGALTLGTGKWTLPQGAVHAVIFLDQFLMSFVS